MSLNCVVSEMGQLGDHGYKTWWLHKDGFLIKCTTHLTGAHVILGTEDDNLKPEQVYQRMYNDGYVRVMKDIKEIVRLS